MEVKLVVEAYRCRKFERLANEDGIGPESLLFLRLLHPIYQHLEAIVVEASCRAVKQRLEQCKRECPKE